MMRYSNEKHAEVEKAVEWLIGPAVVVILATVVCAMLLSQSSGI